MEREFFFILGISSSVYRAPHNLEITLNLEIAVNLEIIYINNLLSKLRRLGFYQ